MEHYLKKLPDDIRDLIHRIRDVSAELNMPAFLVGGIVRDLLLGVKDFDLDIVVEGSGIDFAARFCQGLECRLVTHKRFGTATVHHGNRLPPQAEGAGCASALKIDFASTRSETYPHPGALPVISPSGLRDDLFRRDFTINTLAIGLNTGTGCALIDLFEGKKDLTAGVIRVLHDKSFIDDPTRILRAVRFEQRFGFRIEPRTLRLLKDAVRTRMLREVSPQRLRDELLLMLKEETPEKAVVRMGTLAGWDFLSSRVPAGMRHVSRLFPRIRAEAARFRQRYPAVRQPELRAMYLAALFYKAGRATALSICRKFGFSRKECAMITAYAASQRKVETSLSHGAIAPSVLFRMLNPLPDEIIVLVRAQSRSRDLKRHIDEFFNSCRGVRVSISGYDLQRLGIRPGPEYRRIFRRLLDARLNGKVTTADDELAFVRRHRKDLS
jgi:tRNA nucleotidyltransferase (CCA-adding enzyme)